MAELRQRMRQAFLLGPPVQVIPLGISIQQAEISKGQWFCRGQGKRTGNERERRSFHVKPSQYIRTDEHLGEVFTSSTGRNFTGVWSVEIVSMRCSDVHGRALLTLLHQCRVGIASC